MFEPLRGCARARRREPPAARSAHSRLARTGRPGRASGARPPSRTTKVPLTRSGRHIDDAVLAHIWPSHYENVHFYGTHSVDDDGELAKLDADGYRPPRGASTTAEAR